MAKNAKSLLDKLHKQVQERAQKQVEKIEVELMTKALAQLLANGTFPSDEIYKLAPQYGVDARKVWNKAKTLNKPARQLSPMQQQSRDSFGGCGSQSNRC
jgi:hypothetical protein